MRPANFTVPGAGATSGEPTATATSTPRCPAPNGESGGSNARTTGPDTGQSQLPGSSATATAGVTKWPSSPMHAPSARVAIRGMRPTLRGPVARLRDVRHTAEKISAVVITRRR